MEFKDKVLTCRDCGAEFVFTAGEQQFYAEKGFENEPVRCKECRIAKKRARNESGGPRELYTIICSACGKEAQVPFKPRNDRPVYCKECFEAQRA
ncbi:MAG TPA: zinc-binding protein [Firmicutes bacterium]|nr:zinc-binding protein [Bacillota bacterium]